MYVYFLGVDDHFCLQFVSNRRKAERWINQQLQLYEIYYKGMVSEYNVLANREFVKQIDRFKEYESSINENTFSCRRLENRLRKLLEEEGALKSN
ncbi:hypothetical protein [Bacillus thuringiensis]|uniref:hypothetical protein n=1 Tax=Bacillus thuringiensis TaxID=1428 RepID=UPI0011A9D4D5|nr:hypothetical protein [Bacillus thuringiensis]